MARARRAERSSGDAASGDERALELTRRLAALLAELGLSEVEVESADVRVRVQRGSGAPAPLPAPVVADARVLVENGHAVEYGQPLFLIDPQP
jgi:hypothetical protein